MKIIRNLALGDRGFAILYLLSSINVASALIINARVVGSNAFNYPIMRLCRFLPKGWGNYGLHLVDPIQVGCSEDNMSESPAWWWDWAPTKRVRGKEGSIVIQITSGPDTAKQPGIVNKLNPAEKLSSGYNSDNLPNDYFRSEFRVKRGGRYLTFEDVRGKQHDDVIQLDDVLEFYGPSYPPASSIFRKARTEDNPPDTQLYFESAVLGWGLPGNIDRAPFHREPDKTPPLELRVADLGYKEIVRKLTPKQIKQLQEEQEAKDQDDEEFQVAMRDSQEIIQKRRFCGLGWICNATANWLSGLTDKLFKDQVQRGMNGEEDADFEDEEDEGIPPPDEVPAALSSDRALRLQAKCRPKSKAMLDAKSQAIGEDGTRTAYSQGGGSGADEEENDDPDVQLAIAQSYLKMLPSDLREVLSAKDISDYFESAESEEQTQQTKKSILKPSKFKPAESFGTSIRSRPTPDSNDPFSPTFRTESQQTRNRNPFERARIPGNQVRFEDDDPIGSVTLDDIIGKGDDSILETAMFGGARDNLPKIELPLDDEDRPTADIPYASQSRKKPEIFRVKHRGGPEDLGDFNLIGGTGLQQRLIDSRWRTYEDALGLLSEGDEEIARIITDGKIFTRENFEDAVKAGKADWPPIPQSREDVIGISERIPKRVPTFGALPEVLEAQTEQELKKQKAEEKEELDDAKSQSSAGISDVSRTYTDLGEDDSDLEGQVFDTEEVEAM